MKNNITRQSGQYTRIAPFYDMLNQGADYKKTADYIERVFEKYEKTPSVILDLACGTGNLTLELDRRGYDMIGADASSAMLAEAVKKKRARKDGDILWLNQDMRKLDLFGTVDAVVCCYDSLNYLIHPSDIAVVFDGVYKFLNYGGIFIFDVNSKHKFENIYGKNNIIIDVGRVFCIWRNSYSAKNCTCNFHLTFFCSDEFGKYVRFEERQTEKFYDMDFLAATLIETGFKNINYCADFNIESSVVENSERICFFAEK